MKFDEGKARWDLLPWDLVKQTVDVLTLGAQKYAPNNWQTVEPARYKAALFRHLLAYLDGETADPESGITHLAHAVCNLIFIHELEKHEKSVDVLPGEGNGHRKISDI